MRKTIVTVLLLIICLAVPASTADITPLLLAVRPIAGPMYSEDDETLVGYRNFCTASAINSKGYWLTAAHCVENQMLIEGHPAIVLFYSKSDDMAVIFTPDYQPTHILHLGTAPNMADHVMTYGHALGFNQGQFSQGYIANLDTDFIDNGRSYGHYMTWFMGTCGGHSGSPVVDDHFGIVSIVQVGVGAGMGSVCSSLGGGATYVQLLQAADYFEIKN